MYSRGEASATATTIPTRSVRILRNGRSQAIRIPREFALPGNEATITRDRKGRLIVEPIKKPNPMDLVALLHSWEPLSMRTPCPQSINSLLSRKVLKARHITPCPNLEPRDTALFSFPRTTTSQRAESA
jgi:antitoxin VapB